ncbi:FxsB family radical SAM/SPASM domain protein [Micromonospora yasonensis]|uniref:FxsB family cyclophane-forming radical SAM/SPASM peptide maturase n=1 Tax=Micromonospora yasonensis TaxID=1128667 RepID=UPI00222E7E4F|nr:FxsB family cyclophane-forming radical SAM/SPASM peptide maturase [Micromonospora yasonensis]MCW3840029.1 FxsB family radical SAM/SPASM domain protein [Micromonospora yasonensis]
MLKVHSRCDLACDHCYVYEHADQSWRDRPLFMDLATVEAAAGRIADHATAHRLTAVSVVLHGGEPLLLGPRRMREVLQALRGRIEPASRLDLRMQSNGVRLSEEYCDLFVEYDVQVGISLDGDRAANDRHRRFAHGGSSHAQVRRGLGMLRREAYRRQFAGILCTIDLANDPIAVYEALRAEEPPRIDLLLPHATWAQPPRRPDGRPTPYAQWLLAVHDRWTADGRPMSIRLFDSLRSTATGGHSGNEWVGLDPADLVVVETDGTWEQVDSLKTAYAGAPATGLSVFTHSVDEVSVLPGIARRQTGLDGLAAECRACPVVRQCGGGLFAHRYREGSGFDNPSAYCADLKELIVSLNARMTAEPAPVPVDGDGADLPDGLLDRIGSGHTDAHAVRFLADSQLAITRALLVAVADSGPASTRAGWELLARLDQEAPEAVDAALRHPYVRVWAVDALRHAGVDRGAGSHLSCVAAAAAVRAGVRAQIEVPVRVGVIHLPSVGAVALPNPATGTATLTVTPESWTIRHGAERARLVFDGDPARDPQVVGARWQASRRLAFGGTTILFEDLDPFRDCHDWKAAERVSAPEFAAWGEAVARAWAAIEADVPHQAAGVRAGLRAVVPLVDDPTGTMRSSTARQAFASVGLARADGPATAVMIVHEFQHSVLGALLDLCDLFTPEHTGRLSVGWRNDPRPIEGVLQGTYAHLAITDIWRQRARRAGADSVAHERHQQYRAWTADAADALLGSGALTPAGERFVGRIAEALAS